MRSLRLRLLTSAVLGVCVALAVAGVLIVGLFAAHVEDRYVQELDDHLLQLAAAVESEPSGKISLRQELSDPQFLRPLSGQYWQVAQDGKVLLGSRSLWDSGLTLVSGRASDGTPARGEIAGPRGRPLVLVERVIELQGRPLQLAVAGDRRVVDEARGELARMLAASLATLAALLAAASWLQVGAGLAPLQTLRIQLARLREGRAQRLEGTYPVELSGLVDDLNGLMATQAREVERARQNAGKLGHGLKTPLALLSAEARALRERGEAAAAAAIEHEIETMNAAVARILANVRAVGPRKAVGASTPVVPQIARLIAVMKRLPRGGDLDWSVDAAREAVAVAVDPRDLDEVLGNLLDNARKWAKGRVRIIVAADGGSATLAVEDDGPGIPLERATDVLDGGTRLDPTVPGTGIGLAIARDLVELHGGRISVETSGLGGTRITLTLPAAGARI